MCVYLVLIGSRWASGVPHLTARLINDDERREVEDDLDTGRLRRLSDHRSPERRSGTSQPTTMWIHPDIAPT